MELLIHLNRTNNFEKLEESYIKGHVYFFDEECDYIIDVALQRRNIFILDFLVRREIICEFQMIEILEKLVPDDSEFADNVRSYFYQRYGLFSCIPELNKHNKFCLCFLNS